jgi:tetratricopeptide (TPR) repeat protein
MAANGSVLVNQALEAFKTRDRDRAAQLLGQVVALGPPLGASWGPVSRLANAIGEVTIAVTAAERHAAVDPADPTPRLNLGQMLAHNGRHLQARAVGEALVRDQPANPAAWHFLGTCRAQLGDNKGAIRDLRHAIALPRSGAGAAWAWLAIAGAKTFSKGDPDIPAMQALLRTLGSTPHEREARSALQYALGKAWDEVGDIDAAFAAYADGAAIVEAGRKIDPEETDAFVDDVIARFDTAMLGRLPRGRTPGTRPIFVLGLPRSGTTLVEQILVSHDDVLDGAELNLFRTAAMPIRSFSPEAIEAWAAAHPTGFDRIGEAYLHLLDERFGPGGRVVDKTLNHSRYLGLIHAVLPEARFIWLRREPAGIAWSCFRTRFARGVDWSWSLAGIGRYFRGEDRLHAHWTRVMGEAILTVPYEALVTDPDAWIPRIVAHAGLPWQAGLKDFHKTERAVSTASFAQVRRPMYTSSTEAWRRYEAHLKPFFDAYRGDRTGTEPV